MWVIVLAGVASFDAAVLGACLLTRPARGRPIVYSPAAHPTTPWRGTTLQAEDEATRDDAPSLPKIKRSVPVFDVRLLDGCSKGDLDTVATGINDAISVGAPLYNEGDFDGCYRAYEIAALSVERTTASSCKGPAKVLRTGRERASKLATPAEQAWAMRDAFDGLLDVIDRKGPDL